MDFLEYRLDQPAHKDCRLEPTKRLMQAARQRWIDADFNGEENSDRLLREYTFLKQELAKGNEYQPNF